MDSDNEYTHEPNWIKYGFGMAFFVLGYIVSSIGQYFYGNARYGSDPPKAGIENHTYILFHENNYCFYCHRGMELKGCSMDHINDCKTVLNLIASDNGRHWGSYYESFFCKLLSINFRRNCFP